METWTQSILLLVNNKQKVVTDGYPYLCEDCIHSRSVEGPEKAYAAKMARRNAYDMHRIVYDLHRKFGSEMATESSRKIDKNTPLTL